MLEAYSGTSSASWPRQAVEVQRECGNLPFALALTGSMARAGAPWADLRDALREADVHYVEQKLPGSASRASGRHSCAPIER
jgi:hypothetical protein